MKILITDPLSRKTFDVVNILLRDYNLDDFVFLSDKNHSKVKKIYSIQKCFNLRSKSFNSDLLFISNNYRDHDIIFLPIEEKTIILFYNFITNYGLKNFKASLPSFDSFKLSRNKDELNLFCENNMIPCPKLYSKVHYNFPLIIKPINGSGSEGIKFVKSNNGFNINEVNFENYFIQELLDNSRDIIAGFYLCKDGDVLSFYNHTRIRTFPKKGGVSVYSKSGEDIGVKCAGEKIIKNLNWSGLIMIEFLKDNVSNEFKLIEINPRLWGSILLSEFNNSKFIKSYIELSLGNKLENYKIKQDVFIRWVFPYDFLFFFDSPISFFIKKANTCYLNFTYSTYMKSIKFILLTYFDFKKIKNKIYGK